MIPPIVRLPRIVKRSAAIVVDACLGMLSVWVAFYLRLGTWVALSDRGWQAALIALLAIPIFYFFGVYKMAFRHLSMASWSPIISATIVYLFLYSTFLTAYGLENVPRTIGFIQPILFLILVVLSRIATQFVLGGGYRRIDNLRRVRSNVLIYGAGSAGRQLAAALRESTSIRPVGFIDDDTSLRNSVIGGLTVHARADMPKVAGANDVQEVFLAIPSADRARRNEILDVLRKHGLATRSLPGMLDLAHGNVTVTDVKPLDVDDLLGREPVAPMDELLARSIRGRRVLVTGAGGSIGSELCRNIIRARPSALLLFDMNEYALYAIHHELEGLEEDESTPVKLVPLLGSVVDSARLEDVFAAWKPETVYHAAAYKHVPLVEHNPIEGVRNNVLGTWQTALMANRHKTRDFVLISTDKAVRPTNIMGATKRFAEMILQALAQEGGTTCFSMVRFGNVLGSSGSVVPLFRKQIAMGGPITVTHPDIIRYFMTIPEAAQLVLQAGSMAKGGEVFVLDMGEPVRIYDLAVRMIELSGLKPGTSKGDGDIEISFTGLRPGEKLYEELLIGDNPAPTDHPRVMKASEDCMSLPALKLVMKDVTDSIGNRDVARLRQILMDTVDDFTPSSQVVDWVSLQSYVVAD